MMGTIEALRKEVMRNTVEVPGTDGLFRVGATTSYEVFEDFGSNRPIDADRADKFGETFEETKMNINPITVTKDFVIEDGHHRVLASKKAGTPVHFQIYTGDIDAAELMKIMNINMRNWTLDNFFEHNAKEGVAGYGEALKLKVKYDIDLSSLERFLPVTVSQIKAKVPFELSDDVEYKVKTAIAIKEAEKKVLSNSRRLYKWASAMMLLENKARKRIECYGSKKLEEAWDEDGFEKVVRDLPKVLVKSTANDGTEELAGLLSKAFDYRRKNKFEIL
jgi:hypothetical protein